MIDSLTNRCRDLVLDLKLGRPSDIVEATPLAGGISSDIARVVVGERVYCAKFALENLKVAAEWSAPLRRNLAEYRWLQWVSQLVPNAVPQLFGRSDRCNGFMMEFVVGPDIRNWKAALFESVPVEEDVTAVGGLLGRIHCASSDVAFDRSLFQNQQDFWALRLEPYLHHMIGKHPCLTPRIEQLIAVNRSNEQVALVHGDVSPKNILFRGKQPIFLDAECATMGDPAFDIAFCLNHLVLKGLHIDQRRDAFFKACSAFWEAYRQHIIWEPEEGLQRRVAALLPGLMLARVDGKSPVEYLSAAERDLIRVIAVPMVHEPPICLAGFLEELGDKLR